MSRRAHTIVALTGTPTTTLLQPGTTTGGTPAMQSGAYVNIRFIITRLRVVNTTAGALTVSLFRGAPGAAAAGTEETWSGTSVAGNSGITEFGNIVLDNGQALTGGGSNTGLTLDIDYIIEVV